MAGAFHILAFPGEWNAMIYFFCKLTLRYGQDNIKMRHTRITNLIGLEQKHVVTNHLQYYEAYLPHKPLYLHYSFVYSLCSPYTPQFMGQYRSWSFDSELAPVTRSYRNLQSCVMTFNLWLFIYVINSNGPWFMLTFAYEDEPHLPSTYVKRVVKQSVSLAMNESRHSNRAITCQKMFK